MPMHILPHANVDHPGSQVLNFDAKICHRLGVRHLLQKFVRVITRVWMGKQVAQREPDFSVVRVLYERLPASPHRQERIVQLFRTSCIDYLASNDRLTRRRWAKANIANAALATKTHPMMAKP
jgi:hypothetical protein